MPYFFQSLLFNISLDSQGFPESSLPSLNSSILNNISPHVDATCIHFSRTDTTYSNKDLTCEISSSSTSSLERDKYYDYMPPTTMYNMQQQDTTDHVNEPHVRISSSNEKVSDTASHSSDINNVYKPYSKNGNNKTTTSSTTSSSSIECKKTRKLSKKSSGVWKEEEHNLFLQGLENVGENWKLISEIYVKTRSRRQVASHAQKFLGRKL